MFSSNPARGITESGGPVNTAHTHLSGFGKKRISASRPNCGAIAGLPERAAVEYFMDISKDTITLDENLYISAPFQGLIAVLPKIWTT